MKLSLAFSTCPNDTFIFEALINGRIDLQGLQFDPFLSDVEDLNRMAFSSEKDITKLSYAAWIRVADRYQILQTGSALGRGNGPLLVALPGTAMDDIQNGMVAIPGELTTANLLLSLAYPRVTKKKSMVFSDIESAVLKGEVQAGVLIHENRFTYQERGLGLIRDLGSFWEETTGKPIPLGCIAIHRSVPTEIQMRVEKLIGESLDYAWANPEEAIPYMKRYAQEMESHIMEAHVQTFVNQFSRDLGWEGKAAIEALIDRARALKIITSIPEPIFAGQQSK